MKMREAERKLQASHIAIQKSQVPNFTISDRVSELLYLDSMAVVSTTAAIKKRSERKGQVLKGLSWHIWHAVDDHDQLANVVLHTYRFIKTRAIRITCKSSVNKQMSQIREFKYFWETAAVHRAAGWKNCEKLVYVILELIFLRGKVWRQQDVYNPFANAGLGEINQPPWDPLWG